MRPVRYLLLASALAGATGCGDSKSTPTSSAGTTTKTLAARGATAELTYRAGASPVAEVSEATLARTVSIMRERLALISPTGAVERRGDHEIVITVADDGELAASAGEVGSTRELYFYDWEPNVLGRGCRPALTDPNVTGGTAAGQPGAGTLSYYPAVVRGFRCQPRSYERASHLEPLFYLVNRERQRVVRGPVLSRDDLFADAARTKPTAAEAILAIPGGVILVKAQYDADEQPADPNDAQWYVIQDDPALTGRDIIDPQPDLADDPVGEDDPIVTFDFTEEGRDRWHQITREIARRGHKMMLPGGDPRAAFQHFAMVLDGQLISVPYIDFQQNPDGIDGRNGSQIEGGFTIQSAQNLANALKSGPLPLILKLVKVRRMPEG